MKKLIAIVMVLAILLSCAGCEQLLLSGIWTYIAMDGWGNSSAPEISDFQSSTDEEKQNQIPNMPEITQMEAEQFILDHHAQFSHRCTYMTPEEVATQSVINETFGKAYQMDMTMSYFDFSDYAWRDATAAEMQEVEGLLKGKIKGDNYMTSIVQTKDVQQFYDSIWGKGRIDASKIDDVVFSSGAEWQQLSGGKIAHCYMGYGGTGAASVIYKIVGGEYDRDHNVYIAQAKVLYCTIEYVSEPCPLMVRVMHNWEDPVHAPTLWEGTGFIDISDYDEVLAYAGIREWEIETTDIVLYRTEDGVRLWGVGPSGTVSMPPVVR